MDEFEEALRKVVINSEQDPKAKAIVQEIRDYIDIKELLGKVLTKEGVEAIEDYIFQRKKP